MGCKCGFPNPDDQLYCTVCGGKIRQGTRDFAQNFAEQMFAAPEFVFMIYTVGQRRQLMRGIRFLTLLLAGLILLSLNLVMTAVLMPLYVYWFYFRHHFARKWKKLSYSPISLNVCLVLIAAACIALRPAVHWVVFSVIRF